MSSSPRFIPTTPIIVNYLPDVKGKDLPKAILFKAGGTASGSISLPLKSLSLKFYRKIVIGQARLEGNEQLTARYGLPPDREAFLLLPPESAASGKYITHQGALTFSALSSFLQTYAEVKNWEKIDL